jgi:hypothetical protein
MAEALAQLDAPVKREAACTTSARHSNRARSQDAPEAGESDGLHGRPEGSLVAVPRTCGAGRNECYRSTTC